MADNDQILDHLNKRFDAIEKNMATKSDLQEVKQTQAQTNTALEALAAGQKDIRENMATKADIHRLEQKIDKIAKRGKSYESRLENLEEHTGTSDPHKN